MRNVFGLILSVALCASSVVGCGSSHHGGGGGSTPVTNSLSIATTSLPSAMNGQNYNQPLTASNGAAPYTWTLLSGSLPANVTLSPDGIISGNVAVNGNFPFTVQVTDAVGHTAQANLAINVVTPITISPTLLPAATHGQFYSTSLSASGGSPPYTWSATGLPTGLSIDSSTGVISGTPPAAGTFTNVNVSAKGTGNTGTGMVNYTFTVN